MDNHYSELGAGLRRTQYNVRGPATGIISKIGIYDRWDAHLLLTYSKIVGIYNHRANSSKSELSALKIIIEDSIYRNKFTHS